MGTKPQYLMRRYHKYYIRRAVPDDLRDEIGKTEIIRALGGDRAKAIRRLSLASAEVDAQFQAARLRLGLETAGSLDEAEVKVLALRWFRRADAGAAKADMEIGTGNGLPRAQAVAQADDDLAMLTDPEDPDVATAAMAEADRLMKEEGVKLGTGSPEYRLLCRFITRGMAEATRRGRDRLMGNHSGRHYDAAFSEDAEVPEAAPSPAHVTLGQLVEQFLADPTRTTAKAEDYRTVLTYLAEFVPADTPASRVTRAHCKAVAALLKTLPANATKKRALRGMRPMAAAAEAVKLGMEPMSATTANRYLGRMGTLFRWGVREGLCDHNVAEALRLPKEIHGRDARLPFTIEQLNTIFGAGIYREPKAAWDHRHWIPLIGLFAGLRLNEIATLGTDDVEALGGIDVMRVRPDEAGKKKLKSRAAQRDVPVHRELVEVGFLDFVERQRAAGHEVLFPDLTPDKLGYY
ncbi:MAG: hypothetical protein IIC54_02910, partial [Proteobacteria bacterium]|nr:hypothetical protein [Pseudomonadota bacterium]